MQDYLDLEDAQQNLDRFIGECYNHERLHSSLGYVPLCPLPELFYDRDKGLCHINFAVSQASC